MLNFCVDYNMRKVMKLNFINILSYVKVYRDSVSITIMHIECQCNNQLIAAFLASIKVISKYFLSP